jgi:2-polyprenyl-3-methyl-5-hydroxy-6-metoxy-1,4-benzoquinol methylase
MDLKEKTIFSNGQQRRHPWELVRGEVLVSLVTNHFPSARNKPVIVDIGCGDAFFLKLMSRSFSGAKLIGVDTGLDKEAMEHQSEMSMNIQMYNSFEQFVNAMAVSADTVDIVLLLDVLEHVQNEGEMLKNIVQSPVITPNALFFVTAPAFQSLFTSHDLWLGHYRRYNITQLSQKAEQAGLRIVESGYFFTSLLLPRFFRVMVEKLWPAVQRINKGIGGWQGNDFKDAAIKTILLGDFHISALLNKIGLKIWGLSCYLICQK